MTAPKAAGAEQKLDDLSDAVVGLGDDVELLSQLATDGFEETHDHLDKAHAQLDSLEAKVDKAHAATTRTEEQLSLLVSALWGLGGLLGLGLSLAAYFFTHGARTDTPATVSPAPAPRVTVTVGAGVSAEAKVQPSPGSPEPWDVTFSVEAGEKVPPERYIPKEPLPGQKRAPCEARVSEDEMNGGCWHALLRQPPCYPLYRNGNICYAPILANPREPMGNAPDSSDTAPRGRP